MQLLVMKLEIIKTKQEHQRDVLVNWDCSYQKISQLCSEAQILLLDLTCMLQPESSCHATLSDFMSLCVSKM